MAKRRVTQCKHEGCPNKFISEGRGRPRLFCSDRCKQAEQRIKQKDKLKTKLDLTQEELEAFQAILAVKPEANGYLERIEKICGEIALLEAIRLMIIFRPVKLTLEVRQ